MRSSATKHACRRINHWCSLPSEKLLAALSEQAHRLDLRAEELAIAIKQVWSQLASVRSSRLGERDSDVLRGVVSSSIEVFFESRDADRRGAQLPEQQTE